MLLGDGDKHDLLVFSCLQLCWFNCKIKFKNLQLPGQVSQLMRGWGGVISYSHFQGITKSNGGSFRKNKKLYGFLIEILVIPWFLALASGYSLDVMSWSGWLFNCLFKSPAPPHCFEEFGKYGIPHPECRLGSPTKITIRIVPFTFIKEIMEVIFVCVCVWSEFQWEWKLVLSLGKVQSHFDLVCFLALLILVKQSWALQKALLQGC